MSLNTTQIPSLAGREELVESTIEQVKLWVDESSKLKTSASAARLSGLLQDPNGLEFAVGFVDGVIRPEDLSVAAKNLYSLKSVIPKFLPLGLRVLIRLGANFAPLLPWLVIPIARKVLKSMVSHLVIDASLSKLGRSIRRIRKGGARLNINLLGEAVLGEQEAKARLRKTAEILARKDVDYVSIKVSATVAPHSKWAFNETVADVVKTLTPLYEIAASSEPKKFINLDMEEYHDLDLTVAVFKEILSNPKFANLTGGIVLQAYLPDALRAMIDLQQWAALRVLGGGAPIKVRVVKGANLPMERVDAELHGWPLATVSSKAQADANYKRVLNYALTSERVKNVAVGVAGHNLFDLAFAWVLANQRGALSGMDIEMLLGMAQTQSRVVQNTVGNMILYTPVVHPQEFDVAIAYLIRRLEEGASKDNFLSGAFELDKPEVFEREKNRFLESIGLMADEVPIPNRLQDRHNDSAVVPALGFENAPDTDPAIAQNRSWAYEILERAKNSTLGIESVAASTIRTKFELEQKLESAKVAGSNWGAKDPYERAQLLHKIGVLLEQNRGALIEVAMSEAGKTIDQADTEISEAIDFAHYYAEQARLLEEVDGAVAKPRNLTLVTPPWNFPIAIPAGSALAALAAGSAVIFKPAGQAARCGAVLADLMNQVLPEGVMEHIQISESELGQELISHKNIDQVILTGGYETAKLFRSFSPSLRVLAETSGKNAIVITPNADLDLAAKDLAYSAFGHAGQKCSAASIAILVGSVGKSKRFRRQLLDAVTSLVVDYPTNPKAQMGPLISAPEEKLQYGLTKLERGEKWLLEPKQLDDSGKLWSPGIREGVRPGSPSHKLEFFGPVLSIMTVSTLAEALALQNAVDYGLTAGIHSLEPKEVKLWLSKVQAGNLYVNRGITGAIVERQPFGGWKRSAIGPGAKAGGPNYLLTLSDWESARAVNKEDITTKTVNRLIALAAEDQMPNSELESLLRGAQSDQVALRSIYSMQTDPSNLKLEANRFRYTRSDCQLRIQEDASSWDMFRAVSSILTLGSGIVSATEVAPRLKAILRKASITLLLETQEQWLQRISANPSRCKVIGSMPAINSESPLANCDIALYTNAPTESGRIELLPYFIEQSVSVTTHRFGTPTQLLEKAGL
jgi:RHH-type transcriptional regulator, proline utilization regulon repressor / proline dehydrogenase / delta 1-pyrroline-5-carboxylate dehydrogenase